MILADSGPLIALLMPRDPAHLAVRAWLEGTTQQVLIPTVVIPEVGYIVGDRLGPAAESTFLRLLAEGAFALSDIVPADLPRAAELVDQYADFPLGTVDSLIVAMAERLTVTTLLTLDRRHFSMVRPRHCPAFTLAP